MKGPLRLLLLILAAFLGSLFASPEAEAFGWKTAPDEFFSGTLEDVGENGLATREQCRINGWLNYDTASEYTVAARTPPQAVNATGRARTVDQALTSAERHLGPGYREIAPGVFRSADGTRQFRMTTSDLTGRGMGGQPHVHFERINPSTGKPLRNLHVPLIDP